MTKQEETQARQLEKTSDAYAMLEPVLVIKSDEIEFDMDKWLSYCKCGRLEIVSNKYMSPEELIEEYEDDNSNQSIPDSDN